MYVIILLDMLFQNLKEKCFFLFVIIVYAFLFAAIFFNNVTHRIPKNTTTNFPHIVTSDGVKIATTIRGYVYYLDTKISTPMHKSQIIKHFPNFKTPIKANSMYLLGKKPHPLEITLPSNIIYRREKFRYYPYGEIFFHPVGLNHNGILCGLEAHNTNYKKDSMITTLIFPMQYHLYEGLKRGMKTYNGEKVHGVIQNHEGEIVAIVSLPSFDSNSNQAPINTTNGVIHSIFEMGSTMKIFSFLLAVEEYAKLQHMKFNISAGARIGKYVITDVRNNSGSMSFQEILKRSSNIGTIQVAELIWQKVGMFYNTLLLGDKITFDGFKTPNPKAQWYGAPKYKYLHYCIGYSFSTGMLQILRAFASIFTGKLYNPSLLKSNEKKLPIKEIKFKNQKVILDTLLSISESNPILKKYQVYGKTGTARINLNGVYVKNLINTFYLCSFCKDNKRYFMLLCMEKPKSKVMEASANVKLVAASIIQNIMNANT